jgi:hypothetical protein
MKAKKYYTEQEEGWCAWCGAPLPTFRHWSTKFCRKACNNAYFNGLTADARAEERAKLKCQRCGGPIVGAVKSDTRYCAACRNRR